MITVCEGAAAMVAKKIAGTAGEALAEAPVKKAPAKRANAVKAVAVKKAAPAKKKAPAKTAAPAKDAAAAVKKATVKEAAVKEAAVKKKATVAKTAAKKAAAKTAAKKAAAGKAPSEEAAAVKKAAAGKAPSEEAAAVKKANAVAKRQATATPAGAEGAAQAAKQTGVRNVVAKKSTGTARKAAAAATSGLPKTRVTAATAPGELAVRPGEDPWTQGEVDEARSELVSEVLRLRAELDASEVAISGLMRDSGDGAGDDQADTGTKNITRESELALAANATSMLEQTERALERLEAGTYGICENCGKPIGKARMQAFPRATLCVDCKQKQERRH
ncbi:TraR/DksA family transcriptional regulator [Streptomyces sp. NPDC048349]|uniref:TraR/DksA family transcriptional regulator n=1 Tax=Streptomyces sp. NPDC048349 TaxID=3155486 RepID=UPI003426EE20